MYVWKVKDRTWKSRILQTNFQQFLGEIIINNKADYLLISGEMWNKNLTSSLIH